MLVGVAAMDRQPSTSGLALVLGRRGNLRQRKSSLLCSLDRVREGSTSQTSFALCLCSAANFFLHREASLSSHCNTIRTVEYPMDQYAVRRIWNDGEYGKNHSFCEKRIFPASDESTDQKRANPVPRYTGMACSPVRRQPRWKITDT